jgi:hypothetical protein
LRRAADARGLSVGPCRLDRFLIQGVVKDAGSVCIPAAAMASAHASCARGVPAGAYSLA